MDRVRVGMIGAGRMANAVHYPSLAEIGEAGIAAVCDLDVQRLKETSDRYGVGERFTDYTLMLDKVDLDAVYVIMAPHLLIELVLHCLGRGKHVFIEKPPGISLEQTRRMAEEARRNKCVAMVGFNRRYIPVAREGKGIVEERGPIIQCTATFHKNMLGRSLDWGLVDYLTSDIIHALDALRWMGGEVKGVSSVVARFYSDHVNSFNALLEFERGGVGFLNSNYAVGGRFHALEMHAEGVSAYVSLPLEVSRQEALIQRDGEPYEKAEVVRNTSLVGSEELHRCYGYLQENRHFIDCVREGRQPETSFEDAVKTMELVERILSGPRLPAVA